MDDSGVLDTQLKAHADAAIATREADDGFATCRCCKDQYAYAEVVTLHYGNGLLFAMCKPCILGGMLMIVAATTKGIEVKVVPRDPLIVG